MAHLPARYSFSNSSRVERARYIIGDKERPFAIVTFNNEPVIC
jgi:hypothetical protein